MDKKTGSARQSNFCCSVTKSCLTLCDPTDCSMPGFPVLHHLLEFAQTHVFWASDTIQPSHHLSPPFSSCLLSYQASGSFPVTWLFASGGQSIEALASASVLPMNIQDWFPLGWTGWISPRDAQESSPTSQFKSINSSGLSFLHSPTLTSIHDH